MCNIGYRIINDIKRPDKKLVESFEDIPVANISDNMGRLYSLNSRIKPMNSSHLLGTAITVKTRTADNLLFQKAIDIAKPGDVIVVDVQGDNLNAVAGEIMMRYAMKKKISGFLIDGSIRDLNIIKKSEFPIYACGTTPNGPYKSGPGEINIPISCGGVVINPGDIIVGDQDGVVSINHKYASNLIEKIKLTNELEKSKLSDIEKGIVNRDWIDKKLKKTGYKIN